MSDVFTKVFSIITNTLSNPRLTIIFVLILLFFPLNLLDYFFYIIINILVVVFNVILWIIGAFINFIVWGVNKLFNLVWDLLNVLNVEIGDAPNLVMFDFKKQEYVSVDIFEATACILTIILDFIGISFPIW